MPLLCFGRNKVNMRVIGKPLGANAGFYDQIRIYCMWYSGRVAQQYSTREVQNKYLSGRIKHEHGSVVKQYIEYMACGKQLGL